MFKSALNNKFLFFTSLYLFVLLLIIISSTSADSILMSNFYLDVSLGFQLSFSLMVIYLLIFVLFINKELLKTYDIVLTLPYFFILGGSMVLVNTDNIMVFFIAYEMVLLPSAVLVFLFSPNKRSFLVTLYFLLWTQLGSFLVLLSSLLLYNVYSIFTFSQLYIMNFYFISTSIPVLLLIGFGIKIPVWPFHF